METYEHLKLKTSVGRECRFESEPDTQLNCFHTKNYLCPRCSVYIIDKLSVNTAAEMGSQMLVKHVFSELLTGRQLMVLI